MSDIPLEHLDFQYVRECKNGNEVEKILKALRSGKDAGHYPDLIEFTEKRLRELKPKSKLLIKSQKAVKRSELTHEEERLLKDDLNEWQAKMAEKVDHMPSSNDDELPPVRSGHISMAKPKTSSKSNGTKATRIKSSDYKTWDKYDVDKELAAMETTTEATSKQSSHVPLLTKKELMRCSKSEKETRAVKEKEKGNEAFHAGDLHEAIAYYSRSLQLMPTAIAYNNRAVVEITLEKFNEAVEDCTAVLKLEPLNIKALMRRAIARHKLNRLEEAKEDLELLLKHHRHHKKAKELHETIQNELAKTGTKRRLKIEEVTESPEEPQKHVDKQPASHDAAPSGSHDPNLPESHVPDAKPSGSHDPKPSGSHDVKLPESHVPDVKPSGSHDAKPSGSHDVPGSNQPVHVIPLPVHVIKLKEQGNKLFQTGQYGEALDCYSNAINNIQKRDMNYNSDDVAILFSNRAACYLKIGDCRSCVTDCNTAITMAPANCYKPLLRRALAYETMEKYQLAFVDYQLVINLNGSIEQAKMGCTRLSKLLRDEMGPDWRNKLPLPTDHETVTVAQRSRVTSGWQQGTSNAAMTSTEVKPSGVLTKEQKLKKYEELKEKGNAYVKKGQHSEAVSCYTECIQLCPDNPVAYTNRALCHLKLHAPTAASDDCTKALKLSSDNVKALFRRALAMKECSQLSVAIDDLTAILRIEPGNKAAQKELSVVKELNIAKENLNKKEENKKKRIPIIIDDDSDGQKTSQEASVSGKESDPRTSSHVDVNVTMDKVTPYEFMQKWNSVPRSAGSRPHAALLKQISPQQLPTLLSNKLDGDILPDILLALRDHFLTTDLAQLAIEMVQQLTTVDRFTIIVKFLSTSQKDVVKEIFSYLEEKASDTELTELRKLYGV